MDPLVPQSFDLCELRNLPGRNRSFMFSERPESCENPHSFRLEQLQDSVSSHTLQSFHRPAPEIKPGSGARLPTMSWLSASDRQAVDVPCREQKFRRVRTEMDIEFRSWENNQKTDVFLLR